MSRGASSRGATTPSPFAPTGGVQEVLLLQVFLALVLATTVLLLFTLLLRGGKPSPSTRFLLHEALDEELDPDEALALISGSCARKQDPDGMLPLHLALMRYTAKEQQSGKARLVLALLAEHASGASTPNRFGFLPIHFALASRTSTTIIAALVAAHPDSAAVVGAFKTPPSSSAVSATFLAEFISQTVGGREALAGMTTRRVWDLVIQPAVVASRLPPRPSAAPSATAWAVTHAWDGDFLYTCDALCAFLGARDKEEARSVWFDVFDTSSPPPCTKLLVIVVGPTWEEPSALRRTACLRAVHACVSGGGSLDVAMAPREAARFWADISADAGKFSRMASWASLQRAEEDEGLVGTGGEALAGNATAEEAAAAEASVRTGLDKWIVAELQAQILAASGAPQGEEEAAAWMGVLGRVLLETGRGSEASKLLQQRLDSIRRLRGKDDETALAAQGNLVGVLFAQGLFSEALPLHTDCLDRQQRVLGDLHPSTLTSQSNLALMLAMMGRAEEAVPLYTACLAGRRRALGPLHVDTLQTMETLGQMLESYADAEDEEPGATALRLFSECLDGRTEVLGASHADTLTVQAHLAGLHRNHGRADRALPLLRDLLHKQRRVLGQQHPSTLTTINNLAGLLDSQGGTRAALALYEECLQGRRAALGDRHPETLQAMNNLACMHRSSGRLPQALDLLSECVAIAVEDDPDHPHTLRFRDNLTYAELKQGGAGHAAAARTAFAALILDMERVLGPGHDFTARVRERMREAEE